MTVPMLTIAWTTIHVIAPAVAIRTKVSVVRMTSR